MGLLENFSNLFSKKKEKEKIKIRMESLLKISLPSNLSESIKLVPNREEPEKWESDVEKKIIAYPTKGKLAIQDQQDYEVIGFLLHEISHYNFTTINPAELKIDNPILNYAQTLNAFEDIRIERKIMGKYPGTYDSLKRSNVIAQKSYNEEEVLNKIPDYAILLNNFIRAEWGLEPILNDKIKKAWEDPKLQEAVAEAVKAKTTQEMVNDHIYEKIWSVIKTLIEEQEQSDSDNNGEGEGESNEQEPQNEEDQSIQSLMDKCVDDNKKEELEQEMDEEQKQEQEDKVPVKTKSADSKASSQEEQEEQENSEPEIKDSDFDLAKKTRANQLKEEEETGEEDMSNYIPFLSYEELYDRIEEYLLYFRKKLNSILVDNRLRRSGGSFRSGKLNNKKLYKWKCNDTKLFSKNILRMHKDYNVSLVIDESGSMKGGRSVFAAQTAVLLSEVLDYCSIPFSIVGFNTQVREYKKLNEPYTWTKKRNLENVIPESSGDNIYGTSDGVAINIAASQLDNCVGENIIFVLTDGDSAPSGHSIPDEHRKRLKNKYHQNNDFNIISEVTKASKNALVIGVAITSDGDYYTRDCIIRNYPNNIVIEESDLDQLPIRILQLLQRHIKRG